MNVYWVHQDRLVNEQASMDISSQPGTVAVVLLGDISATFQGLIQHPAFQESIKSKG